MKIQRYVSFGLCALLAGACGSATPPASQPAATSANHSTAHADEIAVLDAYRARPTQTNATAALALVSSSHDVTVAIPGSLLSEFLTGPELDKDKQSMLLAGFIVGNARAQFVANVKGDNFVEGIRGVLLFYQGLRLNSPTIEAAAAAERDGTLPDWATSWQAAHPD